MASEDVIELGSSDEDAEPAPKKRKPMPNAMVHIPNKIPGLTIKPSKSKNHSRINPISLTKGSLGKGLTVTKISSTNIPSRNIVVTNPYANKNKPNGTPIKVISPKLVKQGQQVAMIPIHIKQNTVSGMKPIKISPATSSFIPCASGKNKFVPFNPNITKLPPGITVKQTSSLVSNIKCKLTQVPSNKPKAVIDKKKPRVIAPQELLTVELDDDDSASPAPASEAHKWYIRPEDQNNTTAEDTKNNSNEMEKQNNKEPDTSNFIEITIEDSPIKPPNKRCNEVGAELAITIDDSPGKSTIDKTQDKESDEEETSRDVNHQPHSRKKLNYPAESVNTVEIEIDPIPVQVNNPPEENNIDEHIVEIEESPIKTFVTQGLHSSTPTKVKSTPNKVKEKPQLKLIEAKPTTNDKGEFHPVYQQFIDLCFELENSEDMSKIVEKKIKAYYRQVPKVYIESEEFIDMVSGKITAMKASPEKMYLYIKDVVDELNLQRKMAKAQPVKDAATEEQDKFLYGEDSEFDSKRQRQIRKLEKTLKKLHRAIQKLEEQEVDFDDEEDSVYLLTERYKERMVRVHAKFCQLTNTKMPSEPRVQIDPRLGQPKGPAKKLEKWINKKVLIGTPLPFPDFHDVLRCVRDANEEDKLGWNEADIMDEARDLFMRCGKKLQRRRQENEWRLAASRIASEIDPAEDSQDLKTKLESNRRLASVKETEVLNKYADRQSQLKLEAVEIGDKEAEESPEESEEEEDGEETSLETKEKRKERIKRLLQEKSKKVSQDKVLEASENKPTTSVQNDIDVQKSPAKNDDDQKDNNTAKSESLKNDKEPQEQTKQDTEEEAEENLVHTLSDDSDKVDSDIDELHLLQKLHSGNEVHTSTLESSDSETPIAISDTLSSGDNKMPEGDVISIENSSFSESEDKVEDRSSEKVTQCEEVEEEDEISKPNEKEIENTSTKKASDKIENISMEIECSSGGVETTIHKSNNDEYNESIEDILLASSEDEHESVDQKDKENNGIESKEGNTETNIKESEVKKTNSGNHSNPENESAVNLRDEVISIGETVIEEQKSTESSNAVDNTCDPKMDTESTITESNGASEDNVVEANSIKPLEIVEGNFEDGNTSITEQNNEITEIKISETSSSNGLKNDIDNEVSDKPLDKIDDITQAMDVDIAQDEQRTD